MKRLYAWIFAALLGGTLTAQTNPERMVVKDVLGGQKGFLVERISEVTFPKVEGAVQADIKLLDVAQDKVTFSVTRTAACAYFKLDVVSATVAAQLTDDARAAAYLDQNVSQTYSEDFTSGTISTESLKPKTDYVAITVGYDQYGVACGVSRAPFTTLATPLQGNPEVTYKPVTIEQRSFTITFTPNSDVAGYAVISGEKGTLQQQYEQMGAFFGFANFGDMIKGWGVQGTTEPLTHTWSDLTPGTEYEVFIQAWDKNGTYADYDVFTISTSKAGGSGEAFVTIELGDYKLQDWNGEQKPSQFITFTPNDQSSCYRYNVVLAENYDQDPEGFKADLCSDPPMPTAYWFFYEPMTTDFQIDPSTNVVALAAAKNADNKWGGVSMKRFTTPASVSSAPAVYAPAKSSMSISARRFDHLRQWTPGTGVAPAATTRPAIRLQR